MVEAEKKESKVVAKRGYVADDETTPFHEHRKRRALADQEKAPVVQVWYQWKHPSRLDPKRERKLVKKSRTKNGVNSEFVGWEKQIPDEFLSKIIKAGELKE